jgi:hypothetical protein
VNTGCARFLPTLCPRTAGRVVPTSSAYSRTWFGFALLPLPLVGGMRPQFRAICEHGWWRYRPDNPCYRQRSALRARGSAWGAAGTGWQHWPRDGAAGPTWAYIARPEADVVQCLSCALRDVVQDSHSPGRPARNRPRLLCTHSKLRRSLSFTVTRTSAFPCLQVG